MMDIEGAATSPATYHGGRRGERANLWLLIVLFLLLVAAFLGLAFLAG